MFTGDRLQGITTATHSDIERVNGGLLNNVPRSADKDDDKETLSAENETLSGTRDVVEPACEIPFRTLVVLCGYIYIYMYMYRN